LADAQLLLHPAAAASRPLVHSVINEREWRPGLPLPDLSCIQNSLSPLDARGGESHPVYLVQNPFGETSADSERYVVAQPSQPIGTLGLYTVPLQGFAGAGTTTAATAAEVPVSLLSSSGTIVRFGSPPSIEIPPPDSGADELPHRPPSPNSRASLVSPLLQQSDSEMSHGRVTVDIQGVKSGLSTTANEEEQ